MVKHYYTCNVFHGENASCNTFVVKDPNNYLEKIDINLDNFNVDKQDITKFMCDTFLDGTVSDIKFNIGTYKDKSHDRVENIIGSLLAINGKEWELFHDDEKKEKYDKTDLSKHIYKDFYYFDDIEDKCSILVTICASEFFLDKILNKEIVDDDEYLYFDYEIECMHAVNNEDLK